MLETIEEAPIRSKQCRNNLRILNVNDTMIKSWARIPLFAPPPATYLVSARNQWYENSKQMRSFAVEWCVENCKSRWAITDIWDREAVIIGWLNHTRYGTNGSWEEYVKVKAKFGPYALFKAKWEAVHFKLCLM